MSEPRPRVVIIGGGFAGLEAARALRRAPVQVTVIDRHNYHLFQPLLYQVATAALNPSDIAYPIRSVLRRQANARVLLGEARAIDTACRTVVLENGSVGYDYLVLATGATHSYFGRPQWADHAPGLKTIEDALDIRRRVLVAYEAAEREPRRERTSEWLTFVVVGAGPTGVELAGTLAEIGHYTLAHDFRSVDPTEVRVVLVEAKDQVLPTYPPRLSAKAARHLARLGVEIRAGAMVTEIDERGVVLGEERIAARTVLWAAGVQASPLAKSLGTPLDRAGRVKVESDLSVPGQREIFVVGDLAAIESDGKPVPGMAQAAIQGGRHAAECIRRDLDGRPRAPFRYVDKGEMATIGRAAAVVNAGWLRFSGFWAWVFWWLIHITFLIGFRNRLMVLFGWAWSYLTFRRGARLITGRYPELPAVAEGVHAPDRAGKETPTSNAANRGGAPPATAELPAHNEPRDQQAVGGIPLGRT